MADLGFNVDTGGMDKAQAALDKTTQSAAKTEQQANKTSEALSNIGASQASASISKTAQSADQLAASLVKASSAAQQHLNVAQALETIVTKTGVSYNAANAALTAAISANAGAATATAKHAEALGEVAQAAATVGPKLNEAGNAAGILSRAFSFLGGGGGPPGGSIVAGLSGIGGAAGIAAAALAGLAAAGLKTADDYARLENRFQSITGNMQTGTAAFNSIRDAAKNSGGDIDTFAKAVELASQGANKAGGSLVTFAKDASGLSGELRGLPQLLELLQKAMQESFATGAQESQVMLELFTSVAKGGTLTAQSFQKINDTLPQIGHLIATQFGYQKIDEFVAHLEKTPESLQHIIQALLPIKSKIDEAFHPEAPKTLEEAFRGISQSFTQLEVTLAETGVFDGIKKAMGFVSDQVKLTASDIKQLEADFHTLGQSAMSEVNGIIADFEKLGNVIASVASAITSAGAAAASATGGLAVPGGDLGGIQLSPDSSSGGDQSSYGYFATGGSFTVQGSGGTDSQLVSFHATPGEVVTISGGAGSTSDGSNILAPGGSVDTGGSSGDMAVIDAINNGSTAIVNAIHGLSGGTSITGSTQAITSSVNQASGASGGATNPFGPGGFTFGNVALGELGKALAQQAKAASPSQGGGGGSGSSSPVPGIYGQAKAGPFGGLVGATNPSDPFHPILGQWPLSNMLQGGSEIGGSSGQVVKSAVDQTTDAVKDTSTTVDKSGQDIVSGASSNTGSIISELGSVASSIVNAIASAAAASSSGGASGGGMMGSYGGGYSGGGGYSAYSSGGGDYSTGGDYSGGGSYYSGGGGFGSEIGGSGGSFDPYGGGGGFDPGAVDYGGGGAVDSGGYGYFASGGQFQVGGRGGIDSHAVRFRATPGEVVTITPPGLMPPPSPTGVTRGGRGGHYGGFATGGQFGLGGAYLGSGHTYTPRTSGGSDGTVARVADAVAKAVTRAIPGSYGGRGYNYEDNQPSRWSGGDAAMSAPVSRDQSTGSNFSGERNVTIIVQAGVQAEQFLRSRAQIARAIG